MVRASNIHDFAREPSSPRSAIESFSIALSLSGEISHCGIPLLEHAATAIDLESQRNAMIMKNLRAVAVRSKCEDGLVMEQWVRFQVRTRYAGVMEGSGLEDKDVMRRLKGLVFERMYSNVLWSYAGD